jgi:hypothetical protein
MKPPAWHRGRSGCSEVLSALAQLSQDIPEIDFSTLSAEQLAEIQALVDDSPFSLWAPNPGPQALAYASRRTSCSTVALPGGANRV